MKKTFLLILLAALFSCGKDDAFIDASSVAFTAVRVFDDGSTDARVDGCELVNCELTPSDSCCPLSVGDSFYFDYGREGNKFRIIVIADNKTSPLLVRVDVLGHYQGKVELARELTINPGFYLEEWTQNLDFLK